MYVPRRRNKRKRKNRLGAQDIFRKLYKIRSLRINNVFESWDTMTLFCYVHPLQPGVSCPWSAPSSHLPPLLVRAMFTRSAGVDESSVEPIIHFFKAAVGLDVVAHPAEFVAIMLRASNNPVRVHARERRAGLAREIHDIVEVVIRLAQVERCVEVELFDYVVLKFSGESL